MIGSSKSGLSNDFLEVSLIASPPPSVFHGSKTSGLNTSDLEPLHRIDHTMIHWICGTKDQDETDNILI